MSVEYIPFDPTLIGKEEIIIWCPEEKDYSSMFQTLKQKGVRWMTGERLDVSTWEWAEDFCFRIDTTKKMASHGREYYEQTYSECTFMIYQTR